MQERVQKLNFFVVLGSYDPMNFLKAWNAKLQAARFFAI